MFPFKMVPLVSFLAALRILTEAQICNNGEGKLVFEKLTSIEPLSQSNSNFIKNSSEYELITRPSTPPLKVLEECFRKCQEDQLTNIKSCEKFDFLPGKRLSLYPKLKKRQPKENTEDDYEQSKCVMYNQSNGIVDWNEISPNHGSVWQFNKVCLSSQHIQRKCPNRPFVFEKILSHKLINSDQSKEILVADSNECKNKCLMERTFTCRSASYQELSKKCHLSQANRHSTPVDFKADPEFEYFENMCLNNNEMCKWSVLIIENRKQLDPKFEKHSTTAPSVNNCSNLCLDSLDKYGFICRSFAYDEQNQQCILYDEDPVDSSIPSEGANSNKLVQSTGNLYCVLCSINDKDKDLDNKTLQCFRKKRLRGKHQMEIFASNFYECLSGCMRSYSKHCRSIEYSHSLNICRFSGPSVAGPESPRDTDSLIDDDTFDYYQFMWNDQSNSPNDRQDSIESSHSQPGNYGNFILPVEQKRDHHRGGYAAYGDENSTKQPRPQLTTVQYDKAPKPQVSFVPSITQVREHSGFRTPQVYQVDEERYPMPPSNNFRTSVTFHNRDRNIPTKKPFYSYPSSSSSVNEFNPRSSSNDGFTDPRSTTKNEFRSRSPSIIYPASSNQSPEPYGYTVARTPVAVVGPNDPPSNQGSAANSPSRFASYGVPPYSNINQNSISNYPPSPSISLSYTLPTAHLTIDRYGQLSPASSRPDQNSIQSNGCKYDPSFTSTGSESPRFKRTGFSARLKSKHIYKVVRADRLEDCERFCLETKDFVCKSFNFRAFFPDNCELSNVDTKKVKLDNPDHFEQNTQFDYYERTERKAMMSMTNSMDCFEVLQSCSPEGMELRLKTPDGFHGRIYTYGFYDSCFFDGNGGTNNVLKISKPNGFPRCGTQQVGDAMTNIVVVQFNDYVQTSRDKKYNLTCFISGPGETVVTSNYLDTKTDGRHPMQIEHLPAQNILTSNIVLRILYRGTPTNTIVVGDLLTFRLEARNQYRYNGYYQDIFATDVIAKDPYTGRQVLLIDSRGCPVDLLVFPELHKTADGALEAEFYAFKIPDSNFLVFQATVKTCKGPCEPVICTDRSRGQSFPSWGRKKRALSFVPPKVNKNQKNANDVEEVHELLHVYLQPEDVPESQSLQRTVEGLPPEKTCVDKSTYYLLVLFSILFVLLMIIVLPYYVLVKYLKFQYKDKESQISIDRWASKWPRMSSFMIRKAHAANPQGLYSQSPTLPPAPHSRPNSYSPSIYNEPIYQNNPNTTTAPITAIERSRSMQSLTVQDGVMGVNNRMAGHFHQPNLN